MWCTALASPGPGRAGPLAPANHGAPAWAACSDQDHVWSLTRRRYIKRCKEANSAGAQARLSRDNCSRRPWAAMLCREAQVPVGGGVRQCLQLRTLRPKPNDFSGRKCSTWSGCRLSSKMRVVTSWTSGLATAQIKHPTHFGALFGSDSRKSRIPRAWR